MVPWVFGYVTSDALKWIFAKNGAINLTNYNFWAENMFCIAKTGQSMVFFKKIALLEGKR